MVGESSFDGEGLLTWSVLVFVTIIYPRTLHSDYVFPWPKRGFFSGRRETGRQSHARRALRLCSMRPRTPNWEERMVKEE
jgi:hypothetical protein